VSICTTDGSTALTTRSNWTLSACAAGRTVTGAADEAGALEAVELPRPMPTATRAAASASADTNRSGRLRRSTDDGFPVRPKRNVRTARPGSVPEVPAAGPHHRRSCGGDRRGHLVVALRTARLDE